MVRNMLHRKLWRDIRRSAMQFAALMLLCVLGTFLFSAIGGIANMIDVTNETYFAQNELADFWVTLPSANRETLARIRAIPGVKNAQARLSFDMETTLPGDPNLNVTAVDGEPCINIPILADGEALQASDLRGCLLMAGFARANGLSLGDAVTLRYAGGEYTFFVRGLVYSPEFISVSEGMAANPLEYGYMLVNARALPGIPLTQIVVKLEEGAEASLVREAIAAALPSAFITGQNAHRSTVAARDNAAMFRNLSIVFPLAAFAVAALIVMTTLTRMIDNERMQLGTLRALGFSSSAIGRHYLSYAILPSLLGSVAGTFIGHYAVSPMIWNMIIDQYEYPYRLEPPISPAAWAMVALCTAASAGICLYTYHKSARESTAALLRAKPPKDGKRILLERVTPLWSRLNFNGKMIVRNIMRSKMRSLMSLVGILCCNALLIASMGIQDSVSMTVSNHYNRSLAYDIRADLSSAVWTAEAYEARMDARRAECIMETSACVSSAYDSRTLLLTIAQDEQQSLCLGENEALVPFPTGTVAITRKIAKTLRVQEGDLLTFLLPGDDRPFVLPVGKIVINNLSQGIYLSRSTWEGLRKGAFTPSAILLCEPSARCIARLESMDEVSRLHYRQDEITQALKALDLVSSIFLLIMFIALALAFVICYNMGLINFAERTREYATLKVLGYHQREIRRLILRENRLITLAALALSIVPGLLFTGVILDVCETEAMYYATHVAARSVLVSTLITYCFSGLIQRLLARKVRSIVMVEALKSVE